MNIYRFRLGLVYLYVLLLVGLLAPGMGYAIPNTVDWATYLGGSGEEHGRDVALDPDGNIYIVNQNSSGDFPLVNPLVSTFNDNYMGSISKFSPDGDLLFSSFWGGSTYDQINAIAVDDEGYIYVTGYTASSDFPVLNGYDMTYNGGDVFVSKLHIGIDGYVVWSTFVGGTASDLPMDIQLDDSGRVYISGYTTSDDFPLVNPVQATRAGYEDCFLFRLSADGTNLEFSTYLGGSGFDRCYTVSVAPKYELNCNTPLSLNLANTPFGDHPKPEAGTDSKGFNNGKSVELL
jgi:hypothetical protein